MITVSGVSKRFGDFQALDDVSLTIPDGSLTALLGPSGSGKSTLLRIIAGLEVPDSGTIEIAGDDQTSVPTQQREIGFVFQHYAAFKHMTVRDNIAFGLTIRKRPKAEIASRVDELLGIVGLAGYHERYPSQLSGGQRQRMALARAIGEFGAVSVVSGKISGETETLTLLVEKRFQNFNLAGAYTASALLAVIALVTLLGMTLLSPRKEQA